MSSVRGDRRPKRCWRRQSHEGRGRLKIFSAPHPGSARPTRCLNSRRRGGATASTSSSASSRPHGRRETENTCSTGLKVIPRQQVDYKGHLLAEMDLDAILQRRPQLVLVDELAHTNAPGCRHPKTLSSMSRS